MHTNSEDAALDVGDKFFYVVYLHLYTYYDALEMDSLKKL